jgi:autotransporter passenger strand-loop-strand repeat protein
VESGGEIVVEGPHKGPVAIAKSVATINKGAKVIYGEVTAGIRQNGGIVTHFSQTVHSGGAVVGALIKQGSQFVGSGGSVSNETLKDNSTQQIDKGGHAFEITVSSGCRQTVIGTVDDITVVRALQLVSAGGVVKNSVIGRGATEYLASGSTAINTAIAGGTEEALHGATVQTVRFITSGGKLMLDEPAKPVMVHGFGTLDRLDLLNIKGYAAKISFKENAKGTGGLLKVTDGMHTASVTLFGQYVAAGFHHLGDGSAGGTLVDYQPPAGAGEMLAAPTR